VVRFAVTALDERRNLLNQKSAVRDRRYEKTNCTRHCGLCAIRQYNQSMQTAKILLDKRSVVGL
jgi:formate dehydrogenase assembly factor FdhD